MRISSQLIRPRGWRRALGVRASLSVLVIGCILPIVAVAAFLIVDFYGRERDRIISNTVSQARATMAAVDRDFDTVQAALLALGTSHQLQNGDLAGFHARAGEALRNLRADSIILIGPGGALLMSTRRPFGTPLPKVPSTPLWQRIVATGRPGVSDLFWGPLSGQLIYTVGVPIWRGGAVVMTLNATATPVNLSGLVAEQKLPPSWRAALIDNAGKIVARSHEAQKYAGKSVSPPLRQRLAGGGEGSFESRTLDGIPVFVAYARSARTGWAVAIGIPQDEMTAGLRHTMIWLVVATLAALALGLGLAWRVGGGIARAMLALVQPALAVGAGTALAIPPLAIKEANQLGNALQEAALSVRLAREAEREGGQRLALAADAAALGIWVRDLVRGEIWVSDPWRTLFAFAPEQPVTLELLLQRVHLDDRDTVRRTLRESGSGEGAESYEMEFRIVLPGGGLRWIGSRGRRERQADGTPLLVRGVSLDISKRKLAELDLQQKQKEITHLSRVAVLGELSGALAHELNQPLTAILSNAQAAQRFLRREPADLAEVAEILQDIVDEDQRAGEIIRRLRSLFDKGAGARQRIDANVLLAAVLRILRNDLINHGVALTTRLAADSLTLSADRVQLEQVLVNLVVNACDAMAPLERSARALTARVARDGDAYVRISIVDSGGGIAAEVLEQMFNPFYTTKERGMGLGLSISRNIVDAHQGQLWGENNPGPGASFHLRLPLAAA